MAVSSACTAENKLNSWETPPLILSKMQCSVLVCPYPSAGNSPKRRNKPLCKNGKTEVSCCASSNINSGVWAVKAFQPSCPRTSCFFETDSLFSSHCGRDSMGILPRKSSIKMTLKCWKLSLVYAKQSSNCMICN